MRETSGPCRTKSRTFQVSRAVAPAFTAHCPIRTSDAALPTILGDVACSAATYSCSVSEISVSRSGIYRTTAIPSGPVIRGRPAGRSAWHRLHPAFAAHRNRSSRQRETVGRWYHDAGDPHKRSEPKPNYRRTTSRRLTEDEP